MGEDATIDDVSRRRSNPFQLLRIVIVRNCGRFRADEVVLLLSTSIRPESTVPICIAGGDKRRVHCLMRLRKTGRR